MVTDAMPEVSLTQEELDALDEYSCTLPTGTTIGKRWKRKVQLGESAARWYLGEYTPCDKPGCVGIRWSCISVVTNEDELLIHKRLYGGGA